MHQRALDYFAESEQARARYEAQQPADGPDGAPADSMYINQVVYPCGWPADAGILVLCNEYPAPITLDGHTYPTVAHVYWALSTTDEQQRQSIAVADNPYNAKKAAEDAPHRLGWDRARIALMAQLLRIKFNQHSIVARILLETGQARILYIEAGSNFWGQHGLRGRNWMGRLLELLRAKHADDDFDISAEILTKRPR